MPAKNDNEARSHAPDSQLTEAWSDVAHDAALNRLIFWQGELLNAEQAGDATRALEAAQFIEEYRNLIADMLARRPLDSS